MAWESREKRTVVGSTNRARAAVRGRYGSIAREETLCIVCASFPCSFSSLLVCPRCVVGWRARGVQASCPMSCQRGTHVTRADQPTKLPTRHDHNTTEEQGEHAEHVYVTVEMIVIDESSRPASCDPVGLFSSLFHSSGSPSSECFLKVLPSSLAFESVHLRSTGKLRKWISRLQLIGLSEYGTIDEFGRLQRF